MLTSEYIEEEDEKLDKIIIIQAFNKENAIKSILFLCSALATIIVFFIILFLFVEAGNFFQEVSLFDFLSGETWYPTGEEITGENAEFGALPLIVGTFLVTLGAMIIAIPLGIATSIFISEIAPPKISRYLKAVVELLAGIPSVIYGFFGLIVLNVWLADFFDLSSGNMWLSGSIILAIMALPTIISVSEDAIRSVPSYYREASLALGGTKWQTISKVILPAAMSGITAGVILGIGRAIGETMAVMMVCGNCAIIPEPLTDIFSCIRTMTATIGIEMGEVPSGSLHRQALFALAIVLLLITLVISVIATLVLSRLKRKFEGKTKKRININVQIPDKLSENKGLIFFLILIAFVALIISTWFGWIIALLISSGFVGLFFILKHISAKNQQRIWYGIIFLSTGIVVYALYSIISYIVINGLPAISWEFITEYPEDLGREGGIFPAIIGTLLLVVGAIIYSVPLGMAAGIYLTEYAKDGKITKIIRTGIDCLNGVPSIVFGLFGFVFFVFYLDLGVSMIAGQLTLALMILPTIIRTTEESVKAIPQSFREGSLALGSTKWQSISKVVLPAAIPGIVTGIILGMGRAAGETAPILFTAVVFMQDELPKFVIEPVMALTYHLFLLTTAVPDSEVQAAGTALILLILVILMYSIAIFIRNRYRKKMTW